MRRIFSALAMSACLAGPAFAEGEAKPAEAKPDAPVAEAKPADVKPAEVKAPDVKPPAKPDPKRLSPTADGFFQVGLLFVGWGTFDTVLNAAGDQIAGMTAGLRIRRTEITLKGELMGGKFGYNIMFDPNRVLDAATTSVTLTNVAAADPTKVASATARQPVSANLSPLFDAYVTAKTNLGTFQFGQFKIPIGYEASRIPAAKLLMADRSPIEKAFGDRRDIGLRWSKLLGDAEASNFYAQIDVLNGNGQSAAENNLQKDVAVRLEYTPMKGLMIGGVAYDAVGRRDTVGGLAADGVTEIKSLSIPGTKDRWEGDVKYDANGITVLASFFQARDVGTGGSVTLSQGAYAVAGYMVNENLQPALRFGMFDPDINKAETVASAADSYKEVAVGVNWFFKKHEAKVLLNYARTMNDHKAATDSIIAAVQVWY